MMWKLTVNANCIRASVSASMSIAHPRSVQRRRKTSRLRPGLSRDSAHGNTITVIRQAAAYECPAALVRAHGTRETIGRLRQAATDPSAMSLTLGMIGLGRMGGNMAAGWRAPGTPYSPGTGPRKRGRPRRATRAAGRHPRATRRATARAEDRLADVARRAPTEETLQRLVPLLAPGDVVVDGGNAMYKDSQRHAAETHGAWARLRGCRRLRRRVGSGERLRPDGRRRRPRCGRSNPCCGPWRRRPTSGWVHCGPAGSGHFTKMVHNGIEYGLMQAYAEGLALMQAKSESRSTCRGSPRPGAMAR